MECMTPFALGMLACVLIWQDDELPPFRFDDEVMTRSVYSVHSVDRIVRQSNT